ncbi:MAG: hypothetical protein U0359_23895 [Byssovorax sp.]
MSAGWISDARGALDAARALAEDLPEGPRRGLLLSTIEGCASRLGGPFPDPGAIADALHAAMTPATVLVAEGQRTSRSPARSARRTTSCSRGARSPASPWPRPRASPTSSRSRPGARRAR